VIEIDECGQLTLRWSERESSRFAIGGQFSAWEDVMNELSRRSALALGATAAATSLVAWASPAVAQTYSPTEGEEIFPGVRVVTLGTRESEISAYKTVDMIDVVFQPAAEFPLGEPMEHDMVCQVTEGELQVVAGDMEFAAKAGDVWSCGKGSTRESAVNNGSVPAVMRTIYLKAA
jgi:quercetin dioxygenase-like cupin family protein